MSDEGSLDETLTDETEPLEASNKRQWLSLRASSRPLYFLSKIWGFAPLSNSSAPNLSLIYAVCAAVVLIATHLAAMFLEVVTRAPKLRHIRYFTKTGLIIFNRLCCIVNVLFALTFRKSIFSAVASVEALDAEWKPADGNRAATYLYLELTFMHGVIIVELYVHLQHGIGWPLVLLEECQIAPAILSLSLLILQWSNLVYCLARHMCSLNDRLAKHYPESKVAISQRTPLKKDWMFFLVENEINQGSRGKLQSEEESAKTFSNISALRRHHRGIYDSLQKLQAAYGVSLSIGFAVVLANTVVGAFRFKNSTGKWHENLQFSWFLWMDTLAWLMVFPCQMLLDKTQKCADILHSAMRYDLRPKERKQLLNFSDQLLELPLTCSSNNFLELNNRTLMSVFGTVVSYVIILSQFDSPIKRTQQLTNGTNNCTLWIPEP